MLLLFLTGNIILIDGVSNCNEKRNSNETNAGISDIYVGCRDDHSPVCQLGIGQDSEFATGYGYPNTVFKGEPDTDPDIRNAFIDILRIHAFGKSWTLHNHSFIIFRSTFSAFCAMTLSLSVV